MLSTGLNQLDTHLGGGFFSGSIVTIAGTPRSPIQRTFLNLLAANTTFHISFDQIPEDTIRHVCSQTDLASAEYTRVRELLPPDLGEAPASQVPVEEELEETIESLSDRVTSQSVIALSPINFVEQSLTQQRYHLLLKNLRSLAVESESVVALLAFPHPTQTPRQRLLTQAQSDYLVRLISATETTLDRNSLELAQVRPEQTLAQNRQLFPLTGGNQVDINTEEEVSLQ